MNEHNEVMAKWLAADAPAARDWAFELGVMARIEQRRFSLTVVRSFGMAVASMLVLAALAPWIDRLPALMYGWSQAFRTTDALVIATFILSAALALWQAKLAREG